MKTANCSTRLCAVRLAAMLATTALLPVVAQESATLPVVSGNLTLVNLVTSQTLTLHVQARIVPQGVLFLPAGTVLADAPDSEPILFEVTSLQLVQVQANGVTVGIEADITAVDRASGMTLQTTLYKEDPAAARQLPGGYHHPFPAGDCVTRLQIGDMTYETPCLHLVHSNLEFKASAAQTAP